MRADIVLYDPNIVNTTATFGKPKHVPLEIECVVMNRKTMLEKGKRTGARRESP
jgi:N-acyl-D-aspartate/D-glutamate deacylase